MNKQTIKGMTDEATGEVKEHVGRALGDKQMEAEGHAREMKGKAEKEAGKARDEAEERAEEAIKRDEDLKKEELKKP